MKHSFLDQYSDRNSLIHRLDPRSKFIITVLFILGVALAPPGRWQIFAVYLALIAILILISRVPLLYVLKRSLLIIPFALVIAVFIPFFKGGEVAGSYNVWLWRVSVSDSGVQLLWNILAKAWLSVLALIFLTSTTRLPDLLMGLERLHLPGVMVMILSFMYRYIFVLADEAMRMKLARDSRSFGNGRRVGQVRALGHMVATLFIRSYERGERVYAAMLSRGFDGHSRTLNQLRFRAADTLFGVILGLAIILISVSGIWTR